MIYDCFLFNNELDLLDIRLHELSQVVDKFILVESTETHSCKPKILHFGENKNRYKDFKDKIIHIIVRDTPDVSLGWIVNDYQFCQMARGLKNCRPDDIILFGDLDEIPKAEKILEWKDRPGRLKIFEQILAQYYLNLFEYSKDPWFGTRMTKYKYLELYKSTWVAKFSKYDVVIPDGGWHFSYMGGLKKIREKLNNMTHQEFNKDEFNTSEKIMIAIYNKRDLFNQGLRFKIVDINQLPKYVQANTDKFKDLILDKQYSKNYIYLSILLLKIKNFFHLKMRNVKRFIISKS